MGKPDAPTPPNPVQTAGLATGTNVSTAIANAFLNDTNQVTPTGSLSYAPTDSYSWTDPTTGSNYTIPRFTATQTLSPQQQAIQTQTQAAQTNLAGMANTQSQRISSMLSTPFDPTGSAPAGGQASAITDVPSAATTFNKQPVHAAIDASAPVQTSLDTSGLANAGNITSSYGPSDPTAYAQQVQQALMGQINPQLDIQKANLQQQLADQGVRPGSQAYNNAMMPFGQQQNNAWLQAITGATGQEKTLMDIAAQQAGFANAAQQQAYQQSLGAGTFANQAAGQQFQQNLGAGVFANQAVGQQFQQNQAAATFQNAGLAQQMAQQQAGFNAAQAARNQYMQEQYAQRNQPINEISALLGQSQVTQPNFVSTPGAQIPTTDVAGLINNQFSQQMGIYQQQNANYQSLMGGILGLGAGAAKGMMMSDVRTKQDIDQIGTVFSTNEDGEREKLPIYEYSYKHDPGQRHVGPMAQDVEQIDPGAVAQRGGIKYIDPQRVMGGILRAA
jgi:hypothetical protein